MTPVELLHDGPGLAGAAVRSLGVLSATAARATWTDLLRRTRAADAPATIPRTTFDPRDRAVIAAPYRRLPELHEHPLWINERLDAWIVTRYADVRQAGLDGDVLSSTRGNFVQATSTAIMAHRDRPDHARLRGVSAHMFTREAAARWEQAITGFADEGIERLIVAGAGDVVPVLCGRVTMAAMAALMGIPPQQWRRFRHWSEPMSEVFSPDSPLAAVGFLLRAFPRMVLFRRLIEQELDRRRREPSDDLLGAARRALDSGRITDFEALMNMVLLLVAGQETTASLLSTAFAELARRPALYARLRADRELLPAAIEELARWSSPVQWVGRWSLAPYHVGGHVIPANSRVLLMWMLANRDPARFPDPDALDVDRDTTGHLGFGAGIHFCLGSHLARLEATVVFSRFLDRVERIELAGPVRPGTRVSLYGPASVPLRLTPAA